MPDVSRPKQHLIAIARRYPNAWRQADEFRAGRGKDLPAWPNWCFLPLAGWYAIVSAEAAAGVRMGPEHERAAGDIGRLAALGTWRITQGIYRFDPELFAALVDTPLTGDLPEALFYRLPEWGAYIETPGQRWLGSPLHGFFAHLEWDTNDGRVELRLVLDLADELQPLPIHIGPWPLAEATRRAMAEAKRQALDQGASRLAATMPAQPDLHIDPLISLLLYLCSENAELGDGTQHPVNPAPKRTKRGGRLFAPDQPRIWDVGQRIGAAIRKAHLTLPTDAAEPETAPTSSDRATPRPHWRRAHWHTFWTGPKDGARIARVKWLPPMPVGLDGQELPVVVHPVR